AFALLRDDVHDDGRGVTLGLTQGFFERTRVVTVNGAEVLDVEARVGAAVVGEPAEKAVRATPHAAVEGAARRAEAVEEFGARDVQAAIGALSANAVEKVCHSTD